MPAYKFQTGLFNAVLNGHFVRSKDDRVPIRTTATWRKYVVGPGGTGKGFQVGVLKHCGPGAGIANVHPVRAVSAVAPNGLSHEVILISFSFEALDFATIL